MASILYSLSKIAEGDIIMGIKLGNYQFQGPYTTTTSLENKPGIYAIHCLHKNKYSLLDIGESAQVRSRVESHERMKCWQKNCEETITVSVYYTSHWSQQGRAELSDRLRQLYNPPCGKKIDGILNFIHKK